jgi:glycine oxidase
MKIVIIGAGVAGLGIGWRLAQAGADVTVLERSQPASGASWAAAGMIAAAAEMDEADGAEAVFASYSNGLWPDFAAELERACGGRIGYRQSGALILAQDASALAAMQAREKPGAKVVSPAEARAIAPMLTGEFAGALSVEREAHVDNRALGQALAIAFQRAGGKLQSNEAAVRIERRDGKAVTALTPFHLHHADAFVIAAGAWSGLIEPELAPIVPVKGEMIALAPLAEAMPPAPCIWADGVYAVPRGRLLLVGATVEEAGFDTALTRAAASLLRAKAQAAMPGLKDWTEVDHWAGLRPRAPDGLPLLGPTVVEGLFVAGGQYRNGILFTPGIARMMADLILGQGGVIPAFDPRRFAGSST